ncbi:hypothetical protein VKT23_020122 [Stygiomarasmius scandens]|uniref:Uncharacterized protein n=1 Tax=Marasmiellus scandens TaxID=2682957 RepID=A0ABR1IL28_9AGAR
MVQAQKFKLGPNAFDRCAHVAEEIKMPSRPAHLAFTDEQMSRALSANGSAPSSPSVFSDEDNANTSRTFYSSLEVPCTIDFDKPEFGFERPHSPTSSIKGLYVRSRPTSMISYNNLANESEGITNIGAVADLLHRSEADNASGSLPPDYHASARAHGYGRRAPSRSRKTTGVDPHTPTRPRHGHVASESTSSTSSADASDSSAALPTPGASCVDLTESRVSRRSRGTVQTVSTVRVVRKLSDAARTRLDVVNDEPEEEAQINAADETTEKKDKRAKRWKRTLSDLFSGRKESAGILERNSSEKGKDKKKSKKKNQGSVDISVPPSTPTAFKPTTTSPTDTDASCGRTRPRGLSNRSNAGIQSSVPPSRPLPRRSATMAVVGHHSNHSSVTVGAPLSDPRRSFGASTLDLQALTTKLSKLSPAASPKKQRPTVSAPGTDADAQVESLPSDSIELKELRRSKSFAGWAGALQEQPREGKGSDADDENELDLDAEIDELTREAEGVARRVGEEPSVLELETTV